MQILCHYYNLPISPVCWRRLTRYPYVRMFCGCHDTWQLKYGIIQLCVCARAPFTCSEHCSVPSNARVCVCRCVGISSYLYSYQAFVELLQKTVWTVWFLLILEECSLNSPSISSPSSWCYSVVVSLLLSFFGILRASFPNYQYQLHRCVLDSL